MKSALQTRSLLLLAICFFLLSAADSFSNAFLPVFAGALRPLPGFATRAAAGLPASAFWLFVALAQIGTGWWERGRDHRPLLVGAAALMAAGQALAGFAGSIAALIAARGLCGFGMGVAMILVQDGILRLAGPEARTRASGAYLSLFFAGTICGNPAGGWLAEHAGYPSAFFAAAGLCAVAALIGLAVPGFRSAKAMRRFRPGQVIRNRRLLALVVLAAMPSRLINGAFVFYLAPVELRALDVGAAEAGRITTLYPLILALSIPLWSWLADRIARPALFTLLGLLISCFAMTLAPLGWTGAAGIALAMGILGLGQAFGMSPQVTVLFDVAAREIEDYGRPAILGVFRVAERVGLFLGPFLGAVLNDGFSPGATSAVLAAILLAASSGFSLAFLTLARPIERAPLP